MALSPAGLWWQEKDGSRPLEKVVQEAAARYIARHGGVPDTCYVHPSVVGDDSGIVVSLGNEKVRVLASATIPYPIHFWIGEFNAHREDIPVSTGPEGPAPLKLTVRG